MRQIKRFLSKHKFAYPFAEMYVSINGVKYRAVPSRNVVYFLLNGEEIIYIGITSKFDQRMKSHKYLGKKFDTIFGVFCNYRKDARLVEKEAINFFTPTYNTCHNRAKYTPRKRKAA